MTDLSKIQPVHRQRAACVYIRQSTPHQVEQHRESTARQYALVERARELGWAREQIHVIDEDLGFPAPVMPSGPASRAWPRRSHWDTSASSWGWRSRVWHATMPTGTGCWICAA